MKYNTILFGIMAALCLLLLAPYRLYADAANEPADATRQAWEKPANTPQTPEALLQVIKALFANPDVDGHDFCEKQLGIDRAIWSKYPSGAIDSEYVPSSSMFPPAPFHFSSAALNRQYQLSRLEITFYRNPDFRISPDLIRNILGPPTDIWVTSPKGENSRGKYIITYHYETPKYYFDVLFQNREEESNQEIRSTFRHQTPEQIEKERERRKSFANQKNYQAGAMELNRFEHPRFKKP